MSGRTSVDHGASTGWVDPELIFGQTRRFPPNGAGRHSVFCGGRIVLGPQPVRLVITVVILLVPLVLLGVFVLPQTPTPLIVVCGVSFAACFIFLVLTASTDPGIVHQRLDTRNLNYPVFSSITLVRPTGSSSAAACCTGGGSVVEMRTVNQPAVSPAVSVTSTQRSAAAASGAKQPPELPVLPAAAPELAVFDAKIKFCNTCNRYRAPRTFHCAECDRCIDMYDHHCPWVGTCVGAYNYSYFLWFLIFLQCSLGCAMASCVVAPLRESVRRNETVAEVITSMAVMPPLLFAYAFLLGLPSTVLTLFHLYLVSTGKLTIEHLRRVYANEPNPFDKGCCSNWGRFLGRFDPVNLADSFKHIVVACIAAYQAKLNARREPMASTCSSVATPSAPTPRNGAVGTAADLMADQVAAESLPHHPIDDDGERNRSTTELKGSGQNLAAFSVEVPSEAFHTSPLMPDYGRDHDATPPVVLRPPSTAAPQQGSGASAAPAPSASAAPLAATSAFYPGPPSEEISRRDLETGPLTAPTATGTVPPLHVSGGGNMAEPALPAAERSRSVSPLQRASTPLSVRQRRHHLDALSVHSSFERTDSTPRGREGGGGTLVESLHHRYGMSPAGSELSARFGHTRPPSIYSGRHLRQGSTELESALTAHLHHQHAARLPGEVGSRPPSQLESAAAVNEASRPPDVVCDMPGDRTSDSPLAKSQK